MARLMYGLTSKQVFERAGVIASARYPRGCHSATILGEIVREAIAELRDSRSKPARAETRSGSVHESGGAEGNRPNTVSTPPQDHQG